MRMFQQERARVFVDQDAPGEKREKKGKEKEEEGQEKKRGKEEHEGGGSTGRAGKKQDSSSSDGGQAGDVGENKGTGADSGEAEPSSKPATEKKTE